MADRKPDLDSAYALKTPEDSRRLYRDWAESYDDGFARVQEYFLPDSVAEAFAEAGGEAPVLDVGAGTGLLARRLSSLGVGPIDGVDISPEMLKKAEAKGLYRSLTLADLTRPLPFPDGIYGGVASSGTFTHGHVGPDALDGLLRVARPGALFALSINAAVYRAQGFAAKLAALGPAICDLRLPEVAIYGAAADNPHRDDRAVIALFRKV